MAEEHTYHKARLRARGQVTLPSEVRELLGVDPGDDLLFGVDEKGRICIERAHVIPPDQLWFWSDRWQEMERQVEANIAAGRVQRFGDIEEAIADLESLDNAQD
ncbi:MAG: AbrB/MazE/SpoVT family DNA-binding domain-containing protein [Anaerolineales bacterium]|nr:AbrB/MazE/SpoVT family DNA-binding domain-containing protein [Anaerolineales bacterium]